MDRVFTAIERAALPKRVVYSDFAAIAPMRNASAEKLYRRVVGPAQACSSRYVAFRSDARHIRQHVKSRDARTPSSQVARAETWRRRMPHSGTS